MLAFFMAELKLQTRSVNHGCNTRLLRLSFDYPYRLRLQGPLRMTI